MFRRTLTARLLTLAVSGGWPAGAFAQSLTPQHIGLLIEGRIAERLVVLLAAILSLTFGFLSLRGNAIEGKGTLEASAPHVFALKLRNVGSGIFFSLFGTALLLWSVNTKLDLQFVPLVNCTSVPTSQNAPPNVGATPGEHVSYGVGVPQLSDAKERRRLLAALLTAEQLTAPNRPPLNKQESAALAKSVQALESFKAALVDSEVGSAGAYQWWQKLKHDPKFGSPNFEDQLNDSDKRMLEAIEQLQKDALGEAQ